jgi:hypothetical protein
MWTAEQTAAFLRQVDGHRLYALLHLVALRGLRRAVVLIGPPVVLAALVRAAPVLNPTGQTVEPPGPDAYPGLAGVAFLLAAYHREGREPGG